MVSLLLDAWVLPRGAPTPAGTTALPEPLEGPGDRVTVRYPTPSAEWIGAVTEGLRARGPAPGDVRARAGALGAVGARFLDPDDPLRQTALDLLPATAGVSPAMARVVLDGMARDWCSDRLEVLAEEELGTGATLGAMVQRGRRRVMAFGPGLAVHVVSGSVPGVGVSALLRTLLLGAPTLLKPGLGDSVLPVLFAGALAERAPELAARLAVVYWPGGHEAVERAALARADVVAVYGGDETVRTLRAMVPVAARFLPYPHREGVGVVGAGVLGSEAEAREVARDVARAVAVFDQRGCVSPRVVWVEDVGSPVTPTRFARMLAGELEALERTLPSGVLEPRERSALHQFRGTAEMLAAGWGSGDEAEDRPMLSHGGSAPWSVFYDPYRAMETRCVGRVVVVRPFRTSTELIDRLSPYGARLQTVGVAGLGDRSKEVSVALGRIGASRVAPFAAVPFPLPWWHHDGGRPLADLLRWAEVEGP